MGDAFKFRSTLPSKAITAGGNAQIELIGLPLRARVAGFLFEIVGTGTTGAGLTQVVTPRDLAQVIASCDIDSDFLWARITGRGMYVLERMMTGKSVASATQSTTCDDTGETVRCLLLLPLADPRAHEPNDTAVPVRLIREKTINVQFMAALLLDMTNDVTLSGMTLRTTALLVPEDGDVIPTKTRIHFEDWAQATANLSPGHYTHLAIYDETDLAVTLAEYSQMSISMDGAQLFDRVPTQQYVADYNMRVISDESRELSYQAGGTVEFLPLITQPDKYKLTQVPHAEASVRIDIDAGSASAARYLYRQAVAIRPAEARNAMLRFGHDPQSAELSVKTASKAPLQGDEDRVVRHANLLPKRIRR